MGRYLIIDKQALTKLENETYARIWNRIANLKNDEAFLSEEETEAKFKTFYLDGNLIGKKYTQDEFNEDWEEYKKDNI